MPWQSHFIDYKKMIPNVNTEHVVEMCVIAQKCPHLGSTFNAHLWCYCTWISCSYYKSTAIMTATKNEPKDQSTISICWSWCPCLRGVCHSTAHEFRSIDLSTLMLQCVTLYGAIHMGVWFMSKEITIASVH